jgi:thiosulfate reductase cytochrome b subunit
MDTMDASLGSAVAPAAETTRPAGRIVYRHSVVTRVTHWLTVVAMLVLVMSGLQIFNAAPYLDASDKSDPARRVLAIGQAGATNDVGTTRVFGHTFVTTHWLGVTDSGQESQSGAPGESGRAFPGWSTLPAYQDLAGGRRWHFFFGWALLLAGLAYAVAGIVRKDLRLIILRPSDIPKMLPMQLYYLHLRPEPPDHGKYNPLQKAGYTAVLFLLVPFAIVTGLALSPGIDAIAGPLTALLGGRQFARTWHFVSMLLIIVFTFGHVALVASTGVLNNMRSMTLGTYRLGKHEGTGP